MTRTLLPLLTLLVGVLLPGLAYAQAKTICAYDPGGKSGDFSKILEDYKLQAGTWGVQIDIKTYTDEETAAKDYEAGKCDGVVATGVRLQRFNHFPSTIEAIGASNVQSQDGVVVVVGRRWRILGVQAPTVNCWGVPSSWV